MPVTSCGFPIRSINRLSESFGDSKRDFRNFSPRSEGPKENSRIKLLSPQDPTMSSKQQYPVPETAVPVTPDQIHATLGHGMYADISSYYSHNVQGQRRHAPLKDDIKEILQLTDMHDTHWQDLKDMKHFFPIEDRSDNRDYTSRSHVEHDTKNLSEFFQEEPEQKLPHANSKHQVLSLKCILASEKSAFALYKEFTSSSNETTNGPQKIKMAGRCGGYVEKGNDFHNHDQTEDQLWGKRIQFEDIPLNSVYDPFEPLALDF